MEEVFLMRKVEDMLWVFALLSACILLRRQNFNIFCVASYILLRVKNVRKYIGYADCRFQPP